MSDGGATSSSVGLNFAQYLFSILMLYGSLLIGYIRYRRSGLSVWSCIGSSGQHNGRK